MTVMRRAAPFATTIGLGFAQFFGRRDLRHLPALTLALSRRERGRHQPPALTLALSRRERGQSEALTLALSRRERDNRKPSP